MISVIMQWFLPCLFSREKHICSHIPCILHWLFRFILAGIFLYSGYVKWKSPLLFEAVLYTYDLFPNQFIPVIAQYFPWVEIVLGLFLLIGFKRNGRYPAAASTLLLLFFITIIIITYVRGIEVDCGCLGFDDPISPWTITRDILMLIPALYLLCAGPLLRRRLNKK
jgi:uncharacterized membrane protein YphA (DoxX/SURF4 family)